MSADREESLFASPLLARLRLKKRVGWVGFISPVAFDEFQAGLLELTQHARIRACSITARILRATHEGLPVAFIGPLDHGAAACGAVDIG